jgi:hypothetical protein
VIAQPGETGKPFMYRGLKIVESYEMEVALWHKDYPLYKREGMIRKISLNPAQKIPSGHPLHKFDAVVVDVCNYLTNEGFLKSQSSKLN